ncbi:MAG: potassium channel protein [Gloeomargarita sp. SKYBB_i_bin120]|nr:potassium channel protein [Gloeomargarita sp. SKYB120]MDW8178325.1 potassium channel protein [Gloeomargarita sp. SKYBB_i_bin120]
MPRRSLTTLMNPRFVREHWWVSPGLRNLIFFVLAFVGLLVVGVLGYWLLAGWPLLDALYMVVITIFGIGYGEVRPINTPTLRLFTMLMIILGSVTVVGMIGALVQFVTEGEIQQVLESQRMNQKIMELTDHVIICGYGRMGQILAQRVRGSGLPLIIVDYNEERIREATEHGYLAHLGNAEDEETLIWVGVQRARALATVLPDDALNVFVTLTARGLNPKLTILARGEFPATERKLRLAGADHVVLPATIGALRLAYLITHPATLDFFDRNDGRSTINEVLGEIHLRMDELLVPENCALVNQTVADVEVRGDRAFIVVALRRADGTLIKDPDRHTVIQAGDTLIVVGHRGDIPHLTRKFALRRQMQYRGIRQG